MPSQQVTPQTIAVMFARCAFYIPKGILLPVLSTFDQTKDLLEQDDIACAYCHKHIEKVQTARSRIEEKTAMYFTRGQNWLAHKIEQILVLCVWLLTKIFPPAFLNFLNNLLVRCNDRWASPLSSLQCFLSTYRNKLIWYGLLPICLLTGLAWAYGIGIIPEIYAFLAGSYWGGKIINHTANLIVQRKQSEEWAFIKNPITPKTKNEAKNLAIRLIMDICLLSIIQKFYQFVDYCFQAFFAWLLFYVAVKKAGEESCVMMDNLGNEVKKESSILPNYRLLKNAVWLVSYHSFRLAASDSVYKRYEALHEKRHLPEEVVEDVVLPEPAANNDNLETVPLSSRMTLRRSPRSQSLATAR